MQKQRIRQYLHSLALSALIVMAGVGTAAATTTSSSAHYNVTETQFGAGSALNDCSTQYCAKISVGDTTIGAAKSSNYSAEFGFNTSLSPYLEVSTTGGVSDAGYLTTTTTGTASNLIKVRTYLSSGYVMQITGNSPSQGSHQLQTITTPSTSHQGAEQFGINLVANTAPAVGANPSQQPSSVFSFGSAASNYGTANLFQYINGDIVAQSASSSGETDYTMSMILNVSNVTPGGTYTGIMSAVVVPTF